MGYPRGYSAMPRNTLGISHTPQLPWGLSITNWTMKLNVDIACITIQNSFITCSQRTTLYTFSRLINFKIIHNRVMTNKSLHKMKLADDDPRCLYCGSEESLIHAFISIRNL